MNDLKKYIKLNFFVSSGKSVITALTTLLLIPLIIYNIGIEAYGVVTITLLFSGVSSFVDLGLSKAIVVLSGNKKMSPNRVFTSAAFLNLTIVLLIIIAFIISQLLSVNLLGKNLNLSATNTTFLLYVSCYVLIVTLITNLTRAVLESNYLMHIITLGFLINSTALYISVYIVSLFTQNIQILILLPAIIATFILLLNIYFIISKTKVRFEKVYKIHIRFLLSSTWKFLNIGIINSMITPSLRYLFVLKVADTGLYGVFDLAFKIALSLNGFINALSSPMLAVFSNAHKNEDKNMISISYKIFYISLIMLFVAVVSFYFFGGYLVNHFLNNESYKDLLYQLSLLLIISIGIVFSVEVFVRYLMGNNRLSVVFLLKLLTPVTGVLAFLLLKDIGFIFRLILSYSIGLIFTALSILVYFLYTSNKNKKVC